MNNKIENQKLSKQISLSKRLETEQKKAETKKELQRAQIDRKYQRKLRSIEIRYQGELKNEKIKEKNKVLKKAGKETKEIKKKVTRKKVTTLRNECCKIRQALWRYERKDQDDMVTCISSGQRMKWDECDWWHFRDKRHHTRFDFHLDNIRPQSKKDNSTAPRWWHGEKSKYRYNLVNILGEERVYEIENAPRYNRTREEYENLINEGNKRLANIK